jgi:cellulose synthase/poly-beta-1,6-N-acetylglucosamine synthase-like glycosyltransferase
MWIIASLITLGVLLWFFGYRWESALKRHDTRSLNALPLVSILIPAYRSDKTIRDSLESVKNSNYPKKEVIVVNDSPEDNTRNICRDYGVKLIQNERRMGKANALNQAVKKAKGEILFFLDADTVMARDCLSNLIPWFSNPKTAAVSPKFMTKNENKLLTKLVSLENYFISSHFKTHMFFGTLLSFNGCGIAIRRSVFEKLGGWSQTLTEDNELAGRMIINKYRIQYEPKAIVKTKAPETITELKSQRFRWGKGALFAFSHHNKMYSIKPQFFTNVYIYLLLAFAVVGAFFWQTRYFVPFLSIYFIYALSVKEFLFVLAMLVMPLFSHTFTSVTAAAMGHVAILTYPEKGKQKHSDLLLIIPYIFLYLPLINYYYFKGILSGIIDKRKGRRELNFKNW